MAFLVWSLVLLPVLTGGVLACTGTRGAVPAFPVGIAVAAADLVAAVAATVVRPSSEVPLFRGIGFGLAVEGPSGLLLVPVTAVVLAVLWFCATAIGPRESAARFTGLMLVFSGAMLGTVTASGLVPLLVCWEVMGATSWALIGFWWRRNTAVRAANTALLTTRSADLGMYVAAGSALAGGAGSLALDELPELAAPWSTVAAGGLVVAALGKSAQLPFHFWLSRAMEGPSGVSALLHSATMVAAGGYLLLRVHPLLAEESGVAAATAWIGALTALVLGLVAVAQRDLKQLLAASTSAQLGFVVLAAGTGGVFGGTAHLVAHAATKAALFLVAGAWLVGFGTERLVELRGVGRVRGGLGGVFTLAAAVLAGLPPLSLWATKDGILAGLGEHDAALYSLGTAAATLATLYGVKAVRLVLTPPPGGPPVVRQGTESGGGLPPGRAIPAPALLSAAAAVLGVLTLPWTSERLSRAIGVSAPAVPTPAEGAFSAALAVVTAAVVWWWGRRPPPVPARIRSGLRRWGVFGTPLARLPVRALAALAAALATFDDRVLDRGVHALAGAGIRSARALERAVERPLNGGVYTLSAVVGGLGRTARRAQTGLLHQYYAQAVVALLALALLLLVVR